ncbi:hypothetical protein M3Y96_00421700 [Aphelenchoides besseyi]|nr:hypothetical protein M3Y96_00421700 [Aphelenchoides besseyi]
MQSTDLDCVYRRLSGRCSMQRVLQNIPNFDPWEPFPWIEYRFGEHPFRPFNNPAPIEQFIEVIPLRIPPPPTQHPTAIQMYYGSITAPIVFDDEHRYPFNNSCDFIEGRYLFAGFPDNSNIMVIDVWHRVHITLRPIEGPSKSNKLPKNFILRMITNRTGLLILSTRVAFRKFDKPRAVTYAKLIDFDVDSATYTFRKKPCRFVSMAVKHTFTVQGNKLIVTHKSNATSYCRIYRIDFDSKDEENWLILIDIFHEDRANITNVTILNNCLFYWSNCRASSVMSSIQLPSTNDIHPHLLDISGRRRIVRYDMSKHGFLQNEGAQGNGPLNSVYGCWYDDLFYQINCVILDDIQYLGVLHQPTGKRTDYSPPVILQRPGGHMIKMGVDIRSNHLVVVSRPHLNEPYVRSSVPITLRALDIFRFPLDKLGTEPSPEHNPKRLFDNAFWIASENRLLFQNTVPLPLRPFAGLRL